jgi:hypothetical protein
MLVPLETLPGWPAAPPVSVVRTLLLLVGIPLLMFLIVLGISALRPAKSAYDSMQEREAFWVGSGAPEAITERPGGRRAVTAADEAASSQAASGTSSSDSGALGSGAAGSGDRDSGDRGSGNRGGASARW